MLARLRTASDSLPIFLASHEPRASPSSAVASVASASLRCDPAARSADESACLTLEIRSAERHFDRSSWSTYARASAKLGGHTNFGCPWAFRYSMWTVFAASISFCEMNSLGVSSVMSRPRAISELTMAPLYQYTDHEPPIDIFVESAGPRSWNAISLMFFGSVQSKIEMPPWYHACTITSRSGIGINDPLWATQFSLSVCAAGSL